MDNLPLPNYIRDTLLTEARKVMADLNATRSVFTFNDTPAYGTFRLRIDTRRGLEVFERPSLRTRLIDWWAEFLERHTVA